MFIQVSLHFLTFTQSPQSFLLQPFFDQATFDPTLDGPTVKKPDPARFVFFLTFYSKGFPIKGTKQKSTK
jgi:hypothetical protein